MGEQEFSAAFCGSAGGFAAEGGLPTLCGSESAWLAAYIVFFCLLLERYFEIHRLAVSCPPAHLPIAFLIKRALTGCLSVTYLILLGLVVAHTTALPPVLLFSLSAHALLWGMAHCLLRMEFSRFLPQCRLSVRGFWNLGGVEGLVRIFFVMAQHTARVRVNPVTFGDFLEAEGGLPSPLYVTALLLYGATSACQVVLLAVYMLHPNDLPLELLPFVARLLTQGSATLPCYTLPQPPQHAGGENSAVYIGAPGEATLTEDQRPISANAGEEGVCRSLVHPSAPLSGDLLDVSILSVVLTEAQSPSVVHAEYKLQMRSAGRAPWVARRRFRSFVELSRKLQAAFPAFVYPELAAILPRLPPRDHFSDGAPEAMSSALAHASCEQHQLSFQYLERRRRGLESFVRAVVSESAFWISDLLTFLEVPEDLRAALSTRRLIRLNELQHPDQSAVESVAVRQPVRTPAATSVCEAPAVFPLLPSAPPQVVPQRWLPTVVSRSEASEVLRECKLLWAGAAGAPEGSSCSALTAEIWRLRVCRSAKVPFVVHDIRCTAQQGVFYEARRYREFVQLRHKLRRELCVSLPRLPGRLVSSRRDYLFHEQRRLHLELWLKQILADGACAKSPTLLAFLGVLEEPRNHTDDETHSGAIESDAKMQGKESLPSYMISVASFRQNSAGKVLRLLVLRSDAQKERHWELDVTERQIQALHAELCRTFNSHDIRLVPDLPYKGLRLIAAAPESLQASYELYLGELCRNYPVSSNLRSCRTFRCKGLEDFLQEPPSRTPAR